MPSSVRVILLTQVYLRLGLMETNGAPQLKVKSKESLTFLRGWSKYIILLTVLVTVEQSLLVLTLLCLFRYKPTSEVGAFYENPSRLRAHGVQRCLHLPYVPPAG